MMYTIVADAIKDHEVDAKPTDYLMFFCLAKREGMNDIPEDIGPPAPGTKAELVRQECACVRYSGRFEPTTSDRSSRKMGTQIHNFRIFFLFSIGSRNPYGKSTLSLFFSSFSSSSSISLTFIFAVGFSRPNADRKHPKIMCLVATFAGREI